MQACSCLRQRKATGNSIHHHYQLRSCISKTEAKTIKHKNLTLVHTTTATSEDSWKSQLLFGLHITENMTLWGGVLPVLKMKNGYRQCCFDIYFLQLLKSLIFYEKCYTKLQFLMLSSEIWDLIFLRVKEEFNKHLQVS